MEPDYDQLAERLEAAKEIAEPLRRRIWVVAVIAEALKAQGIRPIVVGGSAVEFYTFGGYATADVDLVVGDRTALGGALEKLGFRSEGRMWYRDDLDLVLECPDEDLAGDVGRVLEVQIEDMVCPVIGIEDLIADRLNGYVHSEWEDDRRWVQEMLQLHLDGIDWEYLAERCVTEKTVEALDEIRREIGETG